MIDGKASLTAAYVAACRGLDGLLPPDARLVHDPFGVAFGGPFAHLLDQFSQRAPGVLGHVARGPLAATMVPLLWMQLRTRALDDMVRGFAAAGGRQVLILGAGFDARAVRLADALGDTTVFEVDHPATQARKVQVLAGAPHARVATVYVPWHFEEDPMEGLGARLATVGHDPAAPTLTIWEGVTMYLTPDAIEASLAAIRALSAPGSRLAMTYFDRRRHDRPTLPYRVMSRFVHAIGEPFRFGWIPSELPAWIAQRGFHIVSDESDLDLASRLLPPRYTPLFDGHLRHVALGERVSESRIP